MRVISYLFFMWQAADSLSYPCSASASSGMYSEGKKYDTACEVICAQLVRRTSVTEEKVSLVLCHN